MPQFPRLGKAGDTKCLGAFTAGARGCVSEQRPEGTAAAEEWGARAGERGGRWEITNPASPWGRGTFPAPFLPKGLGLRFVPDF